MSQSFRVGKVIYRNDLKVSSFSHLRAEVVSSDSTETVNSNFGSHECAFPWALTRELFLIQIHAPSGGIA